MTKKDITEKVNIPEGVELEIIGNIINVKSGSKETSKKFDIKNIILKKENGNLIIESKKATKRETTRIYTLKAHVNNMINGMSKNFVYRLEVAYVHFPMTVEVNKEKKEVIIKNFLGEKRPRICKIIDGADIKIEKNIITI